jgi:hypothetical protein
MTKLEELEAAAYAAIGDYKAALTAAYDAAAENYDAAYGAVEDAAYAIDAAWVAYKAELEKTQEENN